MRPPTVLLIGYTGANNTGAEAPAAGRLGRSAGGPRPHAHLTVPTMAKRIGRLLAGEVPSRQRDAPTSER